MTRRCSPDIIEEASPPKAAVAAAVAAFSPGSPGTGRSEQRADLAGPSRGGASGAALLRCKLAAIVSGWALTRPPHSETPCTRRSERPGDAHQARLPSRQLLLASGAQHASPPARALSPALGRRTHGPRARAFPAFPRQIHGRERACAPRNNPGSSARTSAGPGAQE